MPAQQPSLITRPGGSDVIAGGERVGGGERDPAGLGEQHLDPHVVLAGEWQPQQGSVDVAAGKPGGGVAQAASCRSTRQPGRRRANAAMICWVAWLAALE